MREHLVLSWDWRGRSTVALANNGALSWMGNTMVRGLGPLVARVECRPGTAGEAQVNREQGGERAVDRVDIDIRTDGTPRLTTTSRPSLRPRPDAFVGGSRQMALHVCRACPTPPRRRAPNRFMPRAARAWDVSERPRLCRRSQRPTPRVASVADRNWTDAVWGEVDMLPGRPRMPDLHVCDAASRHVEASSGSDALAAPLIHSYGSANSPRSTAPISPFAGDAWSSPLTIDL